MGKGMKGTRPDEKDKWRKDLRSAALKLSKPLKKKKKKSQTRALTAEAPGKSTPR